LIAEANKMAGDISQHVRSQMRHHRFGGRDLFIGMMQPLATE